MSAKYIRADNLATIDPEAHCWDCGDEAAKSPPEDIWTIWNDDILYCPRCAEDEGAGPVE